MSNSRDDQHYSILVDSRVAMFKERGDYVLATSPGIARVYTCYCLLAGSISTWVAMWQSEELSSEELWYFYENNFESSVNGFLALPNESLSTLPLEDMEILHGILNYLNLLTQCCRDRRFIKGEFMVTVLLSTIILCQYFRPTEEGVEGFSNPFSAIAGNVVAPEFLASILPKVPQIQEVLQSCPSLRRVALEVLAIIEKGK